MPSVGQSKTALLEIWNPSERIVMPRYVFLYFLVAFAFFLFFVFKSRLGQDAHSQHETESLSACYWIGVCLCPASRTTLVATRFRVAVICPIIQVPHCIRVFFYFFDLCLLITFFNFIMNYVPIVTFWIFTYHKIWILSIMFCSIWSYWIIYFLACLEVSWRVVS